MQQIGGYVSSYIVFIDVLETVLLELWISDHEYVRFVNGSSNISFLFEYRHLMHFFIVAMG